MTDLWDKECLTKEDVTDGVKTEQGKHAILYWMMKQWIPIGLAKVWAALDLDSLTEDQQEIACSIMWNTIMRSTIWQILEEKKLAQQISKSGLIPSSAEELYKMRTKGEA